jgi:hypothetical protein
MSMFSRLPRFSRGRIAEQLTADRMNAIVDAVNALKPAPQNKGILVKQTKNGVSYSVRRKSDFQPHPFQVTAGDGLAVFVRAGTVFFKTLGPYASQDYEDLGPNSGTLFSNSMTLGKYGMSATSVTSIAANDTSAIILKLEYEAVPTTAGNIIYGESGDDPPTTNGVYLSTWQHTLALCTIVKDTCIIADFDIALDTLTNAWALPNPGVKTVTIYYPIATVTTSADAVTSINQILTGDLVDPYSGHVYFSVNPISP